ncbi:MAG: carboxypeptidase-like regulatory domain-containing protein [Gemmatimonadota bacterium]
MRLVRMNRSLVLALAVAVTAIACGPDEDEVPAAEAGGDAEVVPGAAPPTADDVSEPTAPGIVRGTVRSARTSDPVEGVHVTAGDFGAMTDVSGTYSLPPLPPGSLTVRAHRRGFVPVSTELEVGAGQAAVTDLSLDDAPSPCCELDGDWSARFTLDSAGLNDRPSSRSLDGRLSFDAHRAADERRVARSTGTSDLDFGPLLGSDPGAVDELEAIVFSDDSVAITLFPRLGDWAIELRGVQSADSIRGSWFQRASCCGAYGSFVLTPEASPGSGRGSG